MEPSIKHCFQVVNLQPVFFSYADKCTSQFSQHAFPASNNEKLIMKLWSGDTGFREMTTKSNVRPILIVNGSVLLRISTSTHRSSRSTHSLEVLEKSQCKMKLWSGDTGFREMTTKSNVRPILIGVVGIFSHPWRQYKRTDSYRFSLALNFKEYTSQFSMKGSSGDILPPVAAI
ncbi:hypothetical protein V1477_003239 [Vespula maculifrons]|uniref:Uncharacterized protein n=1 Tax=Vespula maculifrons TaxID=7453 RepID=A0ABD2CU17_VESMC